jgi:hypothetical protein
MGRRAQHNERAEWIRSEEKRRISDMDWRPVQITEVTSYLSKPYNWKSPGNDQIQNYWLKAFPATHRHITKELQCSDRGTGEGTGLTDHGNNLFDTKIGR